MAQAQELDAMTVQLVVWLVGLALALALGVVIASFRFRYLVEKRKAELIEKFLEQGQVIPPELLQTPGAAPCPLPPPEVLAKLQRDHSRRRAVLWLAIAIGVSLLAYVGFDSPRGAAWGILFLCLSIASFVNARFFSGHD
jgi:hypothetical protein